MKKKAGEKVEGQIKIKIRELKSGTDLALSGIVTKMQNQLLNLEYIFEIQVFDIDGEELKIRKNSNIQVKIIEDSLIKTIEIFKSNNDGKNWICINDSAKLNKSIFYNIKNKNKSSLVFELLGYKVNNQDYKSERWISERQ